MVLSPSILRLKPQPLHSPHSINHNKQMRSQSHQSLEHRMLRQSQRPRHSKQSQRLQLSRQSQQIQLSRQAQLKTNSNLQHRLLSQSQQTTCSRQVHHQQSQHPNSNHRRIPLQSLKSSNQQLKAIRKLNRSRTRTITSKNYRRNN